MVKLTKNDYCINDKTLIKIKEEYFEDQYQINY